MHPVYSAMQTTVFEHMSALARRTGAINLGQGFPDGPGDPEAIAAAQRALGEKSSQYPPMAGLPELRAAVAGHYRLHQGLDLDPAEVLVTSGATEALAASILALIRPGDEVLVFAPVYDAYVPLVERAGGVARVVRLSPPEWRITAAMLEAAVTPRTRFVIVNDPLNPTGTILCAQQVATLAEFCVRHDLIAISDEVWEHMIYDGAPHLPLIAAPGMRDRTVKIGSAGKIFSLTGWKVGWVCAAAPLLAGIARAHQFLTFTTPPHLQWAVAESLGRPAEWFPAMRDSYGRSRRRLIEGLESGGFHVLPSAGTWFVTVDLAASGIALEDRIFSDRAVVEAGVASIPVSAFFPSDPIRHIVRFCFTKADETLDAAAERLAAFRQLLLRETSEAV